MHAAPAPAGLLEGWIEGDPVVVGAALAVLVIAALAYLLVYPRTRRRRWHK